MLIIDDSHTWAEVLYSKFIVVDIVVTVIARVLTCRDTLRSILEDSLSLKRGRRKWRSPSLIWPNKCL